VKIGTFFEKFELLANAPDAVERMRELALDLAIHGSLVEHRDSEGDGHALLNSLKKLPPEQNSKSRARKTLPIAPEKTLCIPGHWAQTTVENACRATGFFCDGDWIESKDQDPSGDVRLIQLADVGDGIYRDRSARFMTSSAAARLNCSYLELGDILIARMPDPLGRCCRFPGDQKPSVTVVDVCILRPNVSYFEPDFLVVAFNSQTFRKLVAAEATGTTRSRISRSRLGALPVPLPPLAEQKRIVAKVDALMALCDELEQQQQEREQKHTSLARASLARFEEKPTPVNLNYLFHKSYDIDPAELRKSILTMAFKGELATRNNKEQIAPIEPREQDSIGSAPPYQIPKHWKWGSVVDATCEIVDCPHSTPKWTDEGKYCVRTTELNAGHLDLSTSKYVSDETYRDRIRRICPKENDILYCREGQVGNACRVPPNVELCLGQRMMLMRAALHTDPVFLEYALNAPFTAKRVDSLITGMTAPRVNVRMVRDYWVPFPPLDEQRRIVAKVDQLIALVDELEAKLTRSRKLATDLLEAVVAELTAN